jgi:hypothetical protein
VFCQRWRCTLPISKKLQECPLKRALSRGLCIVMRQDKLLTRGMQVLVKAILDTSAQWNSHASVG